MKKLLLLLFLFPMVSSASFDSDLYYGLSSHKVSELQEFLTDKGHYFGPITGNFYSLTLAGVKSFQSSNGIPSTGYFGPITRTKANSILAISDESGYPVAPIVIPPKTNDDLVLKLNEQIQLLLQQITEIKNQQTILQNIQTQQQAQSQHLAQIQVNTAPLLPTPTPVTTPTPSPAPEPTPEPVVASPIILLPDNKLIAKNISLPSILKSGDNVIYRARIDNFDTRNAFGTTTSLTLNYEKFGLTINSISGKVFTDSSFTNVHKELSDIYFNDFSINSHAPFTVEKQSSIFLEITANLTLTESDAYIKTALIDFKTMSWGTDNALKAVPVYTVLR